MTFNEEEQITSGPQDFFTQIWDPEVAVKGEKQTWEESLGSLRLESEGGGLWQVDFLALLPVTSICVRSGCGIPSRKATRYENSHFNNQAPETVKLKLLGTLEVSSNAGFAKNF